MCIIHSHMCNWMYLWIHVMKFWSGTKIKRNTQPTLAISNKKKQLLFWSVSYLKKVKQLLWNRSSWIGFSRFYTWNCLCTPSGELNSNILTCVHFSFHCANGELCRLKRKWNDNCIQFLGGVCNAMCHLLVFQSDSVILFQSVSMFLQA